MYLHDANGNLTERRDPVGEAGTASASTHFIYGVLDELLSTTHTVAPGGQVVSTSYEYDEAFQLARRTDPVGTITEWQRDGRGLPTTVTPGLGTAAAASESHTYNLDGQPLTRTDARGEDWSTEYDGYGRVAAVADRWRWWTATATAWTTGCWRRSRWPATPTPRRSWCPSWGSRLPAVSTGA